MLDPSSLALALEENNRALVSLALEDWAGWASESGCAVVLTAHPAKAREGEGADYSGSTAWRGLVRALWTLRQPERDKDVNSDALSERQGNPNRPERVARLALNKSNYSWDGIGLTLRTVGGRAGWQLIDDLPPPEAKKGKGQQKTAASDAAAIDATGVV